MKRILLAGLLALGSSVVLAQGTPVGAWKTIDDETKAERSIVRITDNAGVLTGKIEKLMDATKQDSVCDKCEGARKDQKILGMTIVEGVKKNPDEAYWDAGMILDPNNGKTYRVRLTPQEGGKTLQVRGFIGPLYRNQTWVRVE
jgi:uncharacterized protein (DUF2147 family)